MLRCLELCNSKSRRISELSASFAYADSLLVWAAVDRLIELELLEWVRMSRGRRRLKLDTTNRGERILSKRWENLHPRSVFRLTKDDITKRDMELPFSGFFAQTVRWLEERVFRGLNVSDQIGVDRNMLHELGAAARIPTRVFVSDEMDLANPADVSAYALYSGSAQPRQISLEDVVRAEKKHKEEK